MEIKKRYQVYHFPADSLAAPIFGGYFSRKAEAITEACNPAYDLTCPSSAVYDNWRKQTAFENNRREGWKGTRRYLVLRFDFYAGRDELLDYHFLRQARDAAREALDHGAEASAVYDYHTRRVVDAYGPMREIFTA